MGDVVDNPDCLVQNGYDWCDGYQALLDRYGQAHDDRAYLIQRRDRVIARGRSHLRALPQPDAWRLADVVAQLADTSVVHEKWLAKIPPYDTLNCPCSACVKGTRMPDTSNDGDAE